MKLALLIGLILGLAGWRYRQQLRQVGAAGAGVATGHLQQMRNRMLHTQPTNEDTPEKE